MSQLAFIIERMFEPSRVAAAAWPSPAQDYTSEPLDWVARLIAHPPATFIVAAGVDWPERQIQAGDELIVDRSLEPRSGLLVIASSGGQLRLGAMTRAGRIVAPSGFLGEATVWGVAAAIVHRTAW